MIFNNSNNKDQFALSNEELQKFFDSFEWEDKQIIGRREMEYLNKLKIQQKSLILYHLLPKSVFELGDWHYVIDGYRIQRYNKTKIVETNPLLSKFSNTRSL